MQAVHASNIDILQGVFHSPFSSGGLVDVNNDDACKTVPQDSSHPGQGQADGMTHPAQIDGQQAPAQLDAAEAPSQKDAPLP